MHKIQEGGDYQPIATRSMWVLPYVWEEVSIGILYVTQQAKLRKVYKNEWILLTTIARE